MHDAAMSCLFRAKNAPEIAQLTEMHVKQALRFFSQYAKHQKLLDSRRGKGVQKIRVERVNVAEGGQAIVGSTINSTPKSG